MKKTISFIFVFAIYAGTIFGQLKVNSLGRVGIGTTNPQYGALELKSSNNGGLSIYESSDNSPLRLYSYGNYGYLNFGQRDQFGIRLDYQGRLKLGYTSHYHSYGALLNVYTNSSYPYSAFLAFADYPFDWADVVKVLTKRSTDYAFCVRDVTQTGDPHTFYVRGDGTVYAKGQFLTASDKHFKTDISNIDNSLSKIKKLNGVMYSLKEVLPTAKSHAMLSPKSNISKETSDKMWAEKGRKKIGFIAQDLEKVLPEAVYTLPDGNKAIAYSEIIPLLVEAIKEQQAIIEELKQTQINNVFRSASSNNNMEIDEISQEVNQNTPILYQNSPNPFSKQTEINYYIPEIVHTAYLCIYDMQGKQLKQIVIAERGRGSEIISGSEFAAGIYLYGLIADGKQMDVKRMVLTE